MIDLKLIGKRIRELRLKKNLTQSEFASVLTVSFQAVSNWERGIAPPELENLIRIASYFDILVDDLLSPESENLYLGIDGGGTKTEFVLVRENGTVVERLVKPGSNPNDIDLSNSEEILTEGIREMLLKFPSIKTVFGGIAGAGSNNYAVKLCEGLKRSFPKLKIDIQTDAINLFAADDRANMVVISGTGSVVFVKKDSSYMRLGGWGHLLDRGGSAFDIGREAIRTAMDEEDSKSPPSLISKLLRERMCSNSVWENIGKIYDEGKPYIASFARVVFEAYKKKDKKAIEIIDQNAKALADLLNKGVEIYKIKPLAVANGGIFEHHSEIVLPHIAKYTNVNLIINDLPPIYGACRNACKLEQSGIDDSFYTNFKKTYGELIK